MRRPWSMRGRAASVGTRREGLEASVWSEVDGWAGPVRWWGFSAVTLCTIAAGTQGVSGPAGLHAHFKVTSIPVVLSLIGVGSEGQEEP